MTDDHAKRFMLVFYTICGCISGVMVGFAAALLLSFLMRDIGIMLMLSGLSGALVGYKLGEHKTVRIGIPMPEFDNTHVPSDAPDPMPPPEKVPLPQPATRTPVPNPGFDSPMPAKPIKPL